MTDGVWRRTWRPSPTLVMEERSGAGGVVYARWWEPCERTRGRWRERTTGIRLRGPGEAQVLPMAEREVLALGERMHTALLLGRDPAAALVGRRPLGEVIDAYLRAETPGLSLRHRRDLDRAARVISEVLGADTPWSTLTSSSVRTLWRTMAERSQGGRGERWAIRVAELLWRVGSWAALSEDLATGPPLIAPTGWRKSLDNDWARIARRGAEPPLPHRPRYSEEEAKSLWKALDQADPRLRLAVEIGAPGLRPAQVARVRRSDLQLEFGSGVHGLGRVRIPGARGKAGLTVDLDHAARAAVDEALTSMLADRESAYRAGLIRDYALIPGGRLRNGVAPVRNDAMKAISLTTLRVLHEHWERSAGVAPHGLRALRRLGVDMAAQEGPDLASEIKDHLGGWALGSSTRERVYRDAADLQARADAEHLRARLRARLRGSPVSAVHGQVQSKKGAG